jgi:chemotaxis protein MotB
MRGLRTIVVSCGLLSLFLSAGCVSRDEFLRTEFARRKAAERADALERDLADERNKTLALEAEREAMRRELDTKTAMNETLTEENARLSSFVAKLQSQLDEAMKGIGRVEVVEVKLPPELDKALQDLAARYPDQIEYDAEHGAVRWKSDLTFAKGSAEIQSTVQDSLRAFAEIVRSPAASQFDVMIVGHTDNLRIGPVTGRSHPTNWHLSSHRAIAVMAALRNYGIGETRMGCMGYGEFRPRVPNPPRGGEERNRRVEIFLVSGKDRIPGMESSISSAAVPDRTLAGDPIEE